MRRHALAALILVLFTGVAGAQPPARTPLREIVQITGDLYRARNNNYFSIFLVTPDGIILADPVNVAFATWLKEQFGQRFKVPVRYVIYSHSHWDHIEGGAVFADTARFVAHEGVARNMDGRIPQMPGDMLDRNNNGTFELSEIVDPMTNNNNRCGMPASGPTRPTARRPFCSTAASTSSSAPATRCTLLRCSRNQGRKAERQEGRNSRREG